MKVIITGGSGLLGQYLNESLSENKEILTLYNGNEGNCRLFNSAKTDIRNWSEMSRVFNEFRPDAVVHTACYSRPEQCAELSRDEVYKLNVDATEMIARLCSDFNAKLIFTSTDLVYDGEKGGMLSEDADLNPVTLYAESKLMAELAIQKYTENHIILRTALLLGFGRNHTRNNFHLTYEKLRDNQSVNLFHDQFRTPLSLYEASEIINKLVDSEIVDEVFNFGGSEKVSRLDIGKAICNYYNFDSSLINEVSCREAKGVPQVPDVSMDTQKLRNAGIVQRPFSENINHICSLGII